MIKLFKSPKFQLYLNGILFAISLILVPVSIFAGWLSSVEYVSALSILALVFGALGGIAASLGYKDQKSGKVLNPADEQWIEELIRNSIQNRQE